MDIRVNITGVFRTYRQHVSGGVGPPSTYFDITNNVSVTASRVSPPQGFSCNGNLSGTESSPSSLPVAWSWAWRGGVALQIPGGTLPPDTRYAGAINPAVGGSSTLFRGASTLRVGSSTNGVMSANVDIPRFTSLVPPGLDFWAARQTVNAGAVSGGFGDVRTFGSISITPSFTAQGCMNGVTAVFGESTAEAVTPNGSFGTDRYGVSFSVSIEVTLNVTQCCGADALPPDQVAHARDVAMFQAMHAGLRGDPEEIAQRMRFGRACRGCG